jgi:predicted esterase
MKYLLFAILLHILPALSLMAQSDAEWNVPGKTYTLEFPELPPPFIALALDTTVVTRMSVYLPENYSADHDYPLMLWCNGGDGGTGNLLKRPKEITGNRDYICANFPLFKAEFEPMKPDSSNWIWRWLIRDWDHDFLWAAYSVMLEELHRRIPNIERRNSVMGGFSNGAHTVVALLNGDNGIRQYFRRYFIADGGIFLHTKQEMRGMSLLMFKAENNDNTNPMEYIYRDLRLNDIDTEYVLMEGAGHSFSPKHYGTLRDWLMNTWRE